MPKVSVIIPVYNVEPYLRQCLDSVVNQTLKDIEIICINDGSTDGSGKILEEYAAKDSRVKIINKENGGLSSARNTGLDNISSEYCYFVDSDDWIELNTLEKLVNIITSNDVDCVVHSATNIPEDDSCIEMATRIQRWLDRKNKNSGMYIVPLEINKEITSVAWNKLYKTDIINKFHCRFPEGLVNEDEYFLWEYMIHCKKYYYLQDKLYCYLRRANSITGKIYSTPAATDILKIEKLIYELVEKYADIEKYKNYLT